MIKYKMDILGKLSDLGYSSYRIRKEKLLGERALQQIRDGEIVGSVSLDRLCGLLHCQPGDLIEFVEE